MSSKSSNQYMSNVGSDDTHRMRRAGGQDSLNV